MILAPGGGQSPDPFKPPGQPPDRPTLSFDTKTCSNCGKAKPLDDFKPKRGTKPTNVCLACRDIVATSKKRSAQQAPLSPAQPRRMLPRNVNSQDTPSQAAARREVATIQRRHRAARRAGGDPSPTPSLSLGGLRDSRDNSPRGGRESPTQRRISI